jgi:hypothetical protein
LGSGGKNGRSLSPAQLPPHPPKKLVRSYFQKKKKQNKLGVMEHGYNPSYLGGRGRRVRVQGRPQAKVRTNLENKLK